MLRTVSADFKGTPGMTDEDFRPFLISDATLFKNEPFSFQFIYRSERAKEPVTIAVTTELPAETFRVDFVPVRYDCIADGEAGYVKSPSGLYPDRLSPRPTNPTICRRGNIAYEVGVENTLYATDRTIQSILVTVNPESGELTPGKYRVAAKMREIDTLAPIGQAEITLTVLDAALPPMKESYTNWFHVDSLCDFYRVKPYSEAFYRLFRSFIKNAVKHRMNTLLLPAFTPALDTPVGEERQNVGLVEIRQTAEGYAFGFERLLRFLREADACGIRRFEHCPLFSQWGAAHAPVICDTEGRRLFGWETDAAGEEYRAFLRAYLCAFVKMIGDAGYEKERFLFHLSDEPTEKDIAAYENARRTVSDLLADFEIIDALSDLSFYRNGLVGTPVVCMPEAENFAAECPRFWLYYTGTPANRDCTNRLVSNTGARTRVLGVQMYRYRAVGFLHWGYNYYYDRMSRGFFDPRLDPCGYKLFPGCSYLAYPERDGAAPSLREKHMTEAFDDLRALEFLESFIGRDRTLALCESYLGHLDFHTVPEGNAMYHLREAINREIQKHIDK